MAPIQYLLLHRAYVQVPHCHHKQTSNYIVRGNFSASFSAPVMPVVPWHPLLVIYISY
jgi:hypothetical protein